jgi:hypothetical protein
MVSHRILQLLPWGHEENLFAQAMVGYLSMGISWSSVGCWQQTQLPGSRATILQVAQK